MVREEQLRRRKTFHYTSDGICPNQTSENHSNVFWIPFKTKEKGNQPRLCYSITIPCKCDIATTKFKWFTRTRNITHLIDLYAKRLKYAFVS